MSRSASVSKIKNTSASPALEKSHFSCVESKESDLSKVALICQGNTIRIKGKNDKYRFDSLSPSSTEAVTLHDQHVRSSVQSLFLSNEPMTILLVGKFRPSKVKLLGDIGSNSRKASPATGIVQLALKQLVNLIDSDKSQITFKLTMSVIEFDETLVKDLLVKASDSLMKNEPTKALAKALEVEIRTTKDVDDLLKKAFSNQRSLLAKESNSLHKHIIISGVLKKTALGSEGVDISTSTNYCFAVLGGAGTSVKSELTPESTTDKTQTNLSLLQLQLLFDALSKQNANVSGRGSMLTRRLKEYLGYKVNTTMFAYLSTDLSEIGESQQTLNLANSFGAAKLHCASVLKKANKEHDNHEIEMLHLMINSLTKQLNDQCLKNNQLDGNPEQTPPGRTSLSLVSSSSISLTGSTPKHIAVSKCIPEHSSDTDFKSVSTPSIRSSKLHLNFTNVLDDSPNFDPKMELLLSSDEDRVSNMIDCSTQTDISLSDDFEKQRLELVKLEEEYQLVANKVKIKETDLDQVTANNTDLLKKIESVEENAKAIIASKQLELDECKNQLKVQADFNSSQALQIDSLLSKSVVESQELHVQNLGEINRLNAVIVESDELRAKDLEEIKRLNAIFIKSEELHAQDLGKISRLNAVIVESDELRAKNLEEISRLNVAVDDSKELRVKNLGEINRLNSVVKESKELRAKNLGEINRLNAVVTESKELRAKDLGEISKLNSVVAEQQLQIQQLQAKLELVQLKEPQTEVKVEPSQVEEITDSQLWNAFLEYLYKTKGSCNKDLKEGQEWYEYLRGNKHLVEFMSGTPLSKLNIEVKDNTNVCKSAINEVFVEAELVDTSDSSLGNTSLPNLSKKKHKSFLKKMKTRVMRLLR